MPILKQKHTHHLSATGVPREIRRDIKAWEAIRGMWRGKKIMDPVQWQKKIRREWERALP